MAKLKIKKGDTVVVLAGKDKGVTGKVLAALPDRQRVLVEGVNRVKKHNRISAGQRGAKQGGIETREAPIHISNVAVVGDDGKPSKVGYGTNDEGAKVRIARSTGKEI